MNYRRKVRFIVIVLLILIIVYIGKIYLTKEIKGGETKVISNSTISLLSPLNGSKSSRFKLVNIKFDTLCCKAISDDADIGMGSIEVIKSDNNWIKTKKGGKLIITIIDEENNISKTLNIKGGDSINKYFFLDGREKYTINVSNKSFYGIYEYEVTAYNIF